MVTGDDDAGPRTADQSKVPPAKAGAMIEVPAGTVLAGSPPGTKRRDPGAELDEPPVEVPAFEIDALPFPNDPDREPTTSMSWERAGELCRAEGKRLCHELEWELACEGDSGFRYPYGDRYQPDAYDSLVGVVSPLGVRGMGAVSEWTAGEFGGDVKGVKAVRGAKADSAGPVERRCARRTKVEPETEEPWLGFRCCRGPVPELTYETPTYVAPFERLELTAEQFQQKVRAVPELFRIHDDPQMFTREDLYAFRAEAGVSGNISAVGALTWKALRWVPTVGEEIIVATGRDGDDAFVVALYELPGEKVAHAASYVLVNEKSPIILAYTRNPRHIRWMPCWDCPDGGLLTIDDEGLVDISQRWTD